MRRRLSYANVVATLALVFAMSGGALAANHYLISSTKQIAPSVLKSLRGRTGKTGASGKAGATGPAGVGGAQGREGATGTQGAPGAPGAEGQRGPSAAFNVNEESILRFPTTPEEPLTVESLDLPAGSFFVMAKVLINNNAAAGASVECELLLGETQVDPGTGAIHLEKEDSTDREMAVYSGTGSLASPGTAELVCTVNTSDGNYLNRAITAVQVAGLG